MDQQPGSRNLELPILPQALDAEKALLGAMLIDEGAAEAAVVALKPGDFFWEPHALLFRQLRDMHRRGESVNVVTVFEALTEAGTAERLGGRPWLVGLQNAAGLVTEVDSYIAVVEDRAVKRGLIRLLSEFQQRTYTTDAEASTLVEEAERAVFALRRDRRAGLEPLSDSLLETLDEISRIADGERSGVGTPTGFASIDRYLSGLKRKDFALLAGRPSLGKTSLMLDICRNAARETGQQVLIFSLEMSKGAIGHRMLCSEARVDSQRARTGTLRDHGFGGRSDMKNLYDAYARLSGLPIWIDDTGGLSPLAIRARARRRAAIAPVALIAVDYIQQLGGDTWSDNRHQQLGEIARTLKATAKELDAPVLALSQLSRAVERRQDKRPVLSDLLESGSLEAEADVVLLLYRAAYYDREERDAICNPDLAEEAELEIAKHRNGPVGTVTLSFLRRYARFEEQVSPWRAD